MFESQDQIDMVSKHIRMLREKYLEAKLFGRSGFDFAIEIYFFKNLKSKSEKSTSEIAFNENDVGVIDYHEDALFENISSKKIVLIFLEKFEKNDYKKIENILGNIPMLVVCTKDTFAEEKEVSCNFTKTSFFDFSIFSFHKNKIGQINELETSSSLSDPPVYSGEQFRYLARHPRYLNYFSLFLISRLSKKSIFWRQNEKLLSSKNNKAVAEKINAMIIEQLEDPEVKDADIADFLFYTFWPNANTEQKHENWTQNSMNRIYARVSEFLCLLPEYFRPQKILDIGCADGKIVAAMGSHFKLTKENIVGMDIRPAPLNIRESINNIVDTAENESLFGEEFDLITSSVTFHHIPKWKDALKNCSKWLRPGGFLIIRDHDALKNVDRVLLDLHDLAFSLILWENRENPDWETFASSAASWFTSASEMVEEAHECGLQLKSLVRRPGLNFRVKFGEVVNPEDLDDWKIRDMRYFAIFEKK